MKKSSFLLLSLATSLVISNQAPAATPMTLINHTGNTVNVHFSHCGETSSFCTLRKMNQISSSSNNNQLALMAPMNLDRLMISNVDAIDENGKVIAHTESTCTAPKNATTVNFIKEGSSIVCSYTRSKA